MVINGNGGRGSSVGAIGDRSKLFIYLAVAGSIVEVGLQGGGVGGHFEFTQLEVGWDGWDGWTGMVGVRRVSSTRLIWDQSWNLEGLAVPIQVCMLLARCPTVSGYFAYTRSDL